jgi:hypothetical protein
LHDQDLKPLSLYGFKLEGGGAPVEITFSTIWAFFVGKGISIEGNVEGVTVIQATFVDVNTGIYGNTIQSQPHFTLSSSHINAYVKCVDITNMNQLTFIANLLYIQNPGTVILISNGASNVIIGNQFVDLSNSGQSIGVDVTSTINTVVGMNVCVTSFQTFVIGGTGYMNTC